MVCFCVRSSTQMRLFQFQSHLATKLEKQYISCEILGFPAVSMNIAVSRDARLLFLVRTLGDSATLQVHFCLLRSATLFSHCCSTPFLKTKPVHDSNVCPCPGAVKGKVLPRTRHKGLEGE
jgi:hypothetical protein